MMGGVDLPEVITAAMDETQVPWALSSLVASVLSLWKTRADAGHLAMRGRSTWEPGSPRMKRIGVHADVGP
jgi:hypothetical protein